MHPGSVPMEKGQENFTSGMCSFANAAKAGRLSSVLFASVFDLTSRFLSFFLSHQNMSLEFIAISPRQSVSLKARVALGLKTFEQCQDEGQCLVLSCRFIST